MARARADVREAKLFQHRAHMALMIIDAEALLDDTLQVSAPPAHNAIDRKFRACLDKLFQFRLLLFGQARHPARCLVIQQPVRPHLIEPVYPVAQRLPIHPANPRRLCPVHPVAHRRQRQKPPRLIGVSGCLRELPQRISRKVTPQFNSCCHGKNPLPAMESEFPIRGNPPRVKFFSLWYKFNVSDLDHLLRVDLNALLHRCFQEIYPGSPYQPNWHIEVIVAELLACQRGEHRRLIINLPPRHLKSFIGSVVYVAWLLGHDPALQVMCVSYAQDLAEKFARDTRQIMLPAGIRGYLPRASRPIAVPFMSSIRPRAAAALPPQSPAWSLDVAPTTSSWTMP